MAKLAPIFNDAQLINGIPATGGLLFTYAAGSSTKQTTYTDEAGTTPQSNPIVLNARGEPNSPIWLTEGLSYKFVFAPSTDTDPPSSAIRTIDDITGVNDSSVGLDQWVDSGLSPTYVNATQFTLSGDQTLAFQVNRRVKATVTAGTVYGYISVSAYTSLTTVTVVLDSGNLDSGMSSVQLGLITPNNTSIRITTNAIANDAITTAKIDDGAITDVKLANPKLNISDKASTAEAEAGVNDAKYMTSLKTKEAIDATRFSALLSMVRLNTANGYGSTNTKIRRFTNIVTNLGADITYTTSATLGDFFTINTDGIYTVSYSDQFNSAVLFGLTLNSSQLTTNFESVNVGDILIGETTDVGNRSRAMAWSGFLSASDVIRAHANGAAAGTSVGQVQFTIVRVA